MNFLENVFVDYMEKKFLNENFNIYEELFLFKEDNLEKIKVKR